MRFRQDDVERCLRGEETRTSGTGARGAHKDRASVTAGATRRWLKALLKNGARKLAEIRAEAETHTPPVPYNKLWSARKDLQVVSERDAAGKYWWRLPEHDTIGGLQDKAVLFLRESLAGGPLPAKTIQARAEEEGITRGQLYRARIAAEVRIVSGAHYGRANGPWCWCLPKVERKPAGPGEVPSPGDTSGAETPPPKKRRGRPKGSVEKRVHDRNKRMVEEFRAGQFTSFAEAGRAHGVARKEARDIIQAALGAEACREIILAALEAGTCRN
jgi:hypothetical protein